MKVNFTHRKNKFINKEHQKNLETSKQWSEIHRRTSVAKSLLEDRLLEDLQINLDIDIRDDTGGKPVINEPTREQPFKPKVPPKTNSKYSYKGPIPKIVITKC